MIGPADVPARPSGPPCPACGQAWEGPCTAVPPPDDGLEEGGRFRVCPLCLELVEELAAGAWRVVTATRFFAFTLEARKILEAWYGRSLDRLAAEAEAAAGIDRAIRPPPAAP